MSAEAAYFPDAPACADRHLEGTDGGRKIHNEPTYSPTLSDAAATDEELLTQVGIGSKTALTQLFRRHQRTVCNVALRILKDPSEAEDLCQEVFLYLFQKAKPFDASKGSASSWIIQITYHRAMNRRQYLGIREHYTAPVLDQDQIHIDRQKPLIDEIDARALLSRLKGDLTLEQRRTLELFFFEGYSLREISEMTSQALGNVRHHYYRGLERLRASVFPKKDA